MVTEDSPPVPEKKSSRPRKVSAKDEKGQLQADLAKKGLTHNSGFQQKHRDFDIEPLRGHWQEFLTKTINNERHACKACDALYQQYVMDIQPEPVEPSGDTTGESVPVADKIQARRRGRPCRVNPKQENELDSWIRENRKCIYQGIPEKSLTDYTYFCVACQKNVCFFRDSLTYLIQHEDSSSCHKRGLENLGVSREGTIKKSRHPCTGVNLSTHVCTLAEYQESLRLWLSAGQPLILGQSAKKLTMENATWKLSGDAICVRHSSCDAQNCVTACPNCMALADSFPLASEVASWGYRVDLAALANAAAYGSEGELTEQKYLMGQRDYMKMNHLQANFETLSKLTPSRMVSFIRRGFECIGKARRNANFDVFCNLRLKGLNDFSTGNLEKTIFSDLIRKYSMAMMEGKVLEEAGGGDGR